MDTPFTAYLAACVRADRAAHTRRMNRFGERTGQCPYCGAAGKFNDTSERCGNPFRRSHGEA